MAAKQRKSDDPFSRTLGKPIEHAVAVLPITVERAIRPELMPFDMHGQRSRDLEIIRLLEEISRKLDGQ